MITVSIVSGTYNRLAHLTAMLDSARRALPAGVPYEFVIVDGGSTDGTLDYLRQQPDVVLIEHGELRGAIRAFCDGARVAQGRYVLLANDDVTFRPYGIAAAIAHLDDNPHCGAVAFRDNRAAPGYPRGVYKTQTTAVRLANGERSHVTFAQVGLFRRWLGDAVGWWGADDPIMGLSRTYGGDNFLSARIWEEGYAVEEVPFADVTDHVANDDLRHDNTAHTGGIHPDSKAFRDRFPDGAILPAVTKSASDPRPLRILYLPIYEPHTLQHATKRGLRQALKQAALVWEVDYLNSSLDLAHVVKAWQPDIVLSQFHDGRHVTADKLAYIRKLSPHSIWVNWSGDARGLLEPEYIDLLTHVDLQLVVNAGVLREYANQGILASFWQVGYEVPNADLPAMPAYDVVFLGNNTNSHRVEMVARLRAIPGITFGLYGAGWQDADGECLYDFAAACALHQRAKIVIGDTFPGTQGFVSNRMVQVLGDGGFLLHEYIPGIEYYMGVVIDKCYAKWLDLDDLEAQIAYWLQPEHDTQRKQIRNAGQAFIRERYTFEALVRELFEDKLPLIAAKDRAT